MCDMISTELPLNQEQPQATGTLVSPPDSNHATPDPLPPITTHSLPTDLQRLISTQPWEYVSSRSPVGCRSSPPSAETLIDYAATILEMRLADVVRHRERTKKAGGTRSHHSSLNSDDGRYLSSMRNGGIKKDGPRRRKSLDHIHMSVSWFSHSLGDDEGEDEDDDRPIVLLTTSCRMQIRAYVRRIASIYRDNRYHALEHAVHVTMSANKLLDMLHQDEDSDSEQGSPSFMDAKNKFTASAGAVCRDLGGRRGYHKSVSAMSADSESSDKSEAEEGNNNSGVKETQTPLRRGLSKARIASLRSSLVDLSKPEINCAKSTSFRSKRLRPSFSHLVYSDTFTKFAFVFAAIIHDVDHQGVPNARLVVEKDPIAIQYDGKSVAEKHSIKVAFRTLNEREFDEFSSVVFESPDDRLHMHHIVTNLVISTDIASPERMQGTKMRWEEAFSNSQLPPGPLPFGRLSLAAISPPATEIATVTASEPKLVFLQNANRPTYKQNESEMSYIVGEGRRSSLKRSLNLNGGQTVEYFTSSNEEDSRIALRHSVVIETMLNVADVAHSMQSWELFLFWNRNLFEELYDAFVCGRSESNPTNGWYENQLFFYKIYVLPLAEKMQKVGVFGNKGGNFLKNALLIRDQWEREGEKVTKDMVEEVVKFHGVQI